MKAALRRIALWFAEISVVIYFAINTLVGFFFRPINRWLSSLRLVIRLGEVIGSLPPYVVLFVLAVPFVIAEPAKVLALYLIGTGHLVTGVVMLVGAYVVSLLVVERIYHAGEAKLRTIPWFARGMDWLIAARDHFLRWARSTAMWQRATAAVARARLLFRSVKSRFLRSLT